MGREAELQLLRTYLGQPNSKEQSRVVVHGPRGMGKSQLARKYVAEHGANYSAVFWINGQSEESLRMGFASVAPRIMSVDVLDLEGNLPGDATAVSRSVHGVLAWLSDTRNPNWLLVFDRVDSHSSPPHFPSSSSRDYDAYQYFPACNHGAIIITSRFSGFESNTCQGLELKKLEKESSAKVICKASGISLHAQGMYKVVFSLSQQFRAHMVVEFRARSADRCSGRYTFGP